MADPNAALRRPPVRMNPAGLGNILRDDVFWYAPANTFVFSAANENLQQVIPIQSDAHFICTATMYTNTAEAGNAVATTATPYVRVTNGGAVVQITDGGSQRFLSSALVPLNALFGDGKLPHVWEFPHLFRANSSINISITGTLGAAQTIRLLFGGFKIPRGALPELEQ